MKSEPKTNQSRKNNHAWIIDESKCLGIEEVHKLKSYCDEMKLCGLHNKKFTPVRNWFMVELGLNTGLRVTEMASLKHKNILITGERSSIVLIGKGGKKRVIWISAEFKKTCQTYFNYKNRFGYFAYSDLSGTSI